MCLNYSINLQGADIFAAKINIEVQMAPELVIAAVERNGGVITTAFYDPRSLGKNFLSELTFIGHLLHQHVKPVL